MRNPTSQGHTRFARRIAAVVLVAFTCLTLQLPATARTAAAAQNTHGYGQLISSGGGLPLATPILGGAGPRNPTHLILETLGSDGSTPINAASTVKVIALANNLGHPLKRIDATNAASLIPQLHTDDTTRATVQNAAQAGQTILIPDAPLTLDAWRGTGC